MKTNKRLATSTFYKNVVKQFVAVTMVVKIAIWIVELHDLYDPTSPKHLESHKDHKNCRIV